MLIRSTTRGDGTPPERNSILRAIPREEYDRFVADATTVPLRLRQDIIEPQEPIRYVHFPQSGMLSIVNDMRDDNTSIEVGVCGREGFAGVSLLHGIDTQPFRVLVQVAGEGKRISTEAFLSVLEEAPTLTAMLHRYANALMNQASQQAACNRLHSLEQRCAKWLLTTHDHMSSSELPLTQEFLALMLGVRRPGVTVAAQALQDAGLIRYKRGRIALTDREGLEKVACECYDRIREDYEKLLGEFMVPRAVGPGGGEPKALQLA